LRKWVLHTYSGSHTLADVSANARANDVSDRLSRADKGTNPRSYGRAAGADVRADPGADAVPFIHAHAGADAAADAAADAVPFLPAYANSVEDADADPVLRAHAGSDETEQHALLRQV